MTHDRKCRINMVWDAWCFEDLDEMGHLLTNGGVCRTALATPGLLHIHKKLIKIKTQIVTNFKSQKYNKNIWTQMVTKMKNSKCHKIQIKMVTRLKTNMMTEFNRWITAKKLKYLNLLCCIAIYGYKIFSIIYH